MALVLHTCGRHLQISCSIGGNGFYYHFHCMRLGSVNPDVQQTNQRIKYVRTVRLHRWDHTHLDFSKTEFLMINIILFGGKISQKIDSVYIYFHNFFIFLIFLSLSSKREPIWKKKETSCIIFLYVYIIWSSPIFFDRNNFAYSY